MHEHRTPRVTAFRSPGERSDPFDLDAKRVRRRPHLAGILLPVAPDGRHAR